VTSWIRAIRVAPAAFLFVAAALPGEAARAQTLPTSEDCRTCHLALDEERLVEPARLYDTDIHAETGFGCLACHGSAATNHLDEAAGFLSSPRRDQIPEMCGSCHSDAAFMRQFNPNLRVDQVTEYWTSGHGERLRDFNDPEVATCIDCHQVHQIRSPSDTESSVYPVNLVETCARCHADPEVMAGRDIGSDQVDEYVTSIHGRMLLEEGDVSAPVCNDCHGNHGAAPPGVSSVRNVCGQCHATMAEFFDQSAHEEIFDREDLPGCATCHGKHAIELATDASLGERSVGVCQQCHEADDPNGQEFDRIATVLDSLAIATEASRHILEEAEDRGMEVSQALFELEDVTNAEHRARSAIHAFAVGPVRDEVAVGLAITTRAQERGEEALGEHRFRRVGLSFSTAIIVLLIVALLFKIREMEAVGATAPASSGSGMGSEDS
jgi:predicted CXXCH cytochrome family protein